MCRLFQFTDPDSYEYVTRKLRIQGHSTSVRLEKGFWAVFDKMAQREGRSVGRLIGALHDEMRRSDVDLTNFASCLRVLALHYGMSNADRLQERPPGVGGARLLPHGAARPLDS